MSQECQTAQGVTGSQETQGVLQVPAVRNSSKNHRVHSIRGNKESYHLRGTTEFRIGYFQSGIMEPNAESPDFHTYSTDLVSCYFAGFSSGAETSNIRETNFSTHQWRFCHSM